MGYQEQHGEEWTSRPFRRVSTQSEPEDCFHSTEMDSEEEEMALLECQRGCKEYYMNCKRASLEIAESGVLLDEHIQEYENEMDGFRESDKDKAYDDDDDDNDDNDDNTKMTPMSISEELREGFRLVFWVALPMLARQLGSIVSRRILGRIFGRNVV